MLCLLVCSEYHGVTVLENMSSFCSVFCACCRLHKQYNYWRRHNSDSNNNNDTKLFDDSNFNEDIPIYWWRDVYIWIRFPAILVWIFSSLLFFMSSCGLSTCIYTNMNEWMNVCVLMDMYLETNLRIVDSYWQLDFAVTRLDTSLTWPRRLVSLQNKENFWKTRDAESLVFMRLRRD